MNTNEDRINSMNRQELIDHYEHMKEIATRDGLTGLLNRRELERSITERLAAMDVEDKCALFIIDLDDFKSINDNLGHQTGDYVLKQAAKLLTHAFRSDDIVGRLGGDEFVVFISGSITEETVKEKGHVICEQLQLVVGRDYEFLVTASVGIHIAEGRNQSFGHIYRMADLALYKAKKNGKQSFYIKQDVDSDAEPESTISTPMSAIRLHGLLDYIDSGVAMVEMSDEPVFLYASPAFVRMMGSEEELAGKSIASIIHPEDSQKLIDVFRKKVMAEGQNVTRTIRVIVGGASVMWWKIHAAKVEYAEGRQVVLITVTDVSDYKEKESSLKESNELYQLALGQTAHGIWEVELDSLAFRIVGDNKPFAPIASEPVQFPDGLIRKEWIAEESVEDFREFARDMLDGRTQGHGNFLIKYFDIDKYGWTSVSYKMVFDDMGRPVRAVGVIEGLNRYSKENDDGSRWSSVPEGLMSSLVFHINANLSKDELNRVWFEGRDVSDEVRGGKCSETLKKEKMRVFGPDKAMSPAFAFSREGLLGAYEESSRRWYVYEYQRVDGGGNIGWVSCIVNLYSHGKDNDVYLSAWICRNEQRHILEKAFNVSIYKDPITKIYTRSTVRDIAQRMLLGKAGGLSALVMVELGCVLSSSRMIAAMDNSKSAMTIAFSLAMGTNCIIGQFGKNRMIVFVPDVKSEEKLRLRLEQAFGFVREMTSDIIESDNLKFLGGGGLLHSRMRRTMMSC